MTAPHPISMIFADKVFFEHGTMKVHIAGVFGGMFSTQFPWRFNSFSIYQKFTDFVGPKEQEGVYEFRYLDGNLERIAELKTILQVNTDRLNYTDVIAHFNGMVFPRPGKIEVVFSVSGKVANRGTIHMLKLDINQKGEEG